MTSYLDLRQLCRITWILLCNTTASRPVVGPAGDGYEYDALSLDTLQHLAPEDYMKITLTIRNRFQQTDVLVGSQ